MNATTHAQALRDLIPPDLGKEDLAGTRWALQALGDPEASEALAKTIQDRRTVDRIRRDRGRRGTRKTLTLTPEEGTQAPTIRATGGDPEARAETLDLAGGILRRMDARTRDVILRKVRGESTGEIAQALGITDSTVYVYLHRARTVARGWGGGGR